MRLNAWKSSLITVNPLVRVLEPLRNKASIKVTRTCGCQPRTTVVTRSSGTCSAFCAVGAVTGESPQPRQAPLCCSWEVETFRCRADAGEIHSCPRSEGGSAGRRCLAWPSRDARDAEGSPVGREHEPVRSRMTRRQPSRHRHRKRVSPASHVFLSRSLVQLPLQAEHRKRHASTAACREGGKAKRSTGLRTVERHLLSDHTAHYVRNNCLSSFPFERLWSQPGRHCGLSCAPSMFCKCA